MRLSWLRGRLEADPLVVAVLGALVAVRIVFPLVVLAAAGSALPGFPKYRFEARPGDAYGYYSAVRELLATIPRLGVGLIGVAAACSLLVYVALRGRKRPEERARLVLVGAVCIAAIATLLVLRMRASGAVTIGWPLVWSVPLLPYRALGLPLDPEIAFGFGLALSLAANAVTVVATYLLGLWCSGRRAVGLAAASWFGLWPLVVPQLGKTPHLGTWQGELGLSLYSEPLSTALVATGVALLVRPGRGPGSETLAGALLGFAVTVRLSNAVIAAAVVAVLALQSRSGALRVAAGVAAFSVVALAYWPLGYPMLPDDQLPEDLFALRYAIPAWRDSIVWGVRALVVLVPLALLGAAVLPRAKAALLLLWSVTTCVFYTFYFFTPLHPRFLFVALPAVFVLWAAGAAAVVDFLRRHRSLGRQSGAAAAGGQAS